jgi:transcriptional regulator with XRE-family HTH domain
VIRRDRGLTQRELGLAIRKSSQTVALWESQGSAVVRYADARGCAHALHCGLEDLAAPLEAALPAAPANWHRIRLQAERRHRQAKLAATTVSGKLALGAPIRGHP